MQVMYQSELSEIFNQILLLFKKEMNLLINKEEITTIIIKTIKMTKKSKKNKRKQSESKRTSQAKEDKIEKQQDEGVCMQKVETVLLKNSEQISIEQNDPSLLLDSIDKREEKKKQLRAKTEVKESEKEQVVYKLEEVSQIKTSDIRIQKQELNQNTLNLHNQQSEKNEQDLHSSSNDHDNYNQRQENEQMPHSNEQLSDIQAVFVKQLKKKRNLEQPYIWSCDSNKSIQLQSADMSALEHTVDIVPIPALRVYPNIDIESVDSFTERDFEDIQAKQIKLAIDKIDLPTQQNSTSLVIENNKKDLSKKDRIQIPQYLIEVKLVESFEQENIDQVSIHSQKIQPQPEFDQKHEEIIKIPELQHFSFCLKPKISCQLSLLPLSLQQFPKENLQCLLLKSHQPLLLFEEDCQQETKTETSNGNLLELQSKQFLQEIVPTNQIQLINARANELLQVKDQPFEGLTWNKQFLPRIISNLTVTPQIISSVEEQCNEYPNKLTDQDYLLSVNPIELYQPSATQSIRIDSSFPKETFFLQRKSNQISLKPAEFSKCAFNQEDELDNIEEIYQQKQLLQLQTSHIPPISSEKTEDPKESCFLLTHLYDVKPRFIFQAQPSKLIFLSRQQSLPRSLEQSPLHLLHKELEQDHILDENSQLSDILKQNQLLTEVPQAHRIQLQKFKTKQRSQVVNKPIQIIAQKQFVPEILQSIFVDTCLINENKLSTQNEYPHKLQDNQVVLIQQTIQLNNEYFAPKIKTKLQPTLETCYILKNNNQIRCPTNRLYADYSNSLLLNYEDDPDNGKQIEQQKCQTQQNIEKHRLKRNVRQNDKPFQHIQSLKSDRMASVYSASEDRLVSLATNLPLKQQTIEQNNFENEVSINGIKEQSQSRLFYITKKPPSPAITFTYSPAKAVDSKRQRFEEDSPLSQKRPNELAYIQNHSNVPFEDYPVVQAPLPPDEIPFSGNSFASPYKIITGTKNDKQKTLIRLRAVNSFHRQNKLVPGPAIKIMVDSNTIRKSQEPIQPHPLYNLSYNNSLSNESRQSRSRSPVYSNPYNQFSRNPRKRNQGNQILIKQQDEPPNYEQKTFIQPWETEGSSIPKSNTKRSYRDQQNVQKRQILLREAYNERQSPSQAKKIKILLTHKYKHSFDKFEEKPQVNNTIHLTTDRNYALKSLSKSKQKQKIKVMQKLIKSRQRRDNHPQMASANVTYDEKQFICIKEYPIHELKINHPLSYQKHPRKH